MYLNCLSIYGQIGLCASDGAWCGASCMHVVAHFLSLGGGLLCAGASVGLCDGGRSLRLGCLCGWGGLVASDASVALLVCVVYGDAFTMR